MSHPHPDLEVITWGFFEAYTKKVAHSTAHNLRRSLFRRLSHEGPMPDEACCAEQDEFPSEKNEVKINGKVYILRNNLVYQGLLKLDEKLLSSLILHFWEGWTDRQIAAHYTINERTVRKWRKKSIDSIRNTVQKGMKD